ncbi:MAG TPA: hypothetical protein VI750_06305 [Pyrinomonadaceae bacterium]|nr:hypothetical protein [Pyrinomonadaceae bacterium]
MADRLRDEQEMRNGVEVMTWIDHLTAHPDVGNNIFGSPEC